MSGLLGKLGEERAATYLESNNYEIKARNYRHKRNEIDIIALKNNTLIFVEVKARSYTDFGNPEESVDAKKASRVIDAAEQYIYDNDWQGNIRFDVIAVEKTDQQYKVLHFQDAFY